MERNVSQSLNALFGEDNIDCGKESLCADLAEGPASEADIFELRQLDIS